MSQRDFIDRIAAWSRNQGGPVVVHAGHFMLLAPNGERCVPAIVDELTSESEDVRGHVEGLIARFPIATWRMGVELIKRLRDAGGEAHIVALVNDWYFLRRLPEGRAEELRADFYQQSRTLAPTYAKALADARLNESSVFALGPHPVWISEYWLRRRAERRLKKLNHPAVRWSTRTDGVKELLLGELGHECRRLLCGGQADCAEEVLELLLLLHEKGQTTLVNFIPRECECPVNKGCVEAIELFGLRGLKVLNIALPCFGGSFKDDHALQDVRLHTVSSIADNMGGFRAEIASSSLDRWSVTS